MLSTIVSYILEVIQDATIPLLMRILNPLKHSTDYYKMKTARIELKIKEEELKKLR